MTAPALKKSERDHIARCKTDLPYYSKKHLVIRTKEGFARSLEYNFAQRFVHKKLVEQFQRQGNVRAIILKARQEGVSTGVSSRFYRRAHLVSMQRIMVIANETDNSTSIFEFYQRYQDFMSDDLKIATTQDRGDKVLGLENDSKIVVKTANNVSAGRGSTIQALHASEFAFWDKAEDTWTGLRQAVPQKGSEIIIESTANGVGNKFHDMWLMAEQGKSEYIAIFLPWWIHEDYTLDPGFVDADERLDILQSEDEFERQAQDEGIPWEGKHHKLSIERLAWRRRAIVDLCDGDERKFRQEYPATAREAFLVSGDCFFGTDDLEIYELKARPPILRCNLVQTKDGGFQPSPSERGALKLWAWPDPTHRYVIAADTAEGKESAAKKATFSDPENEKGGRDFNSADVIDITDDEHWKVVAHYHARSKPEPFATALNLLGWYYSTKAMDGMFPAYMGVERNHSSGMTVLKKLKEEHLYPNLYYASQIGRRFNKKTPVLGWRTSPESRPIMLDRFAELLRSGPERLEIPCAETIKECFTFVLGEDGKPQAQEGTHDDRVISLAIAIQMADRAPRYESTSNFEDVPIGNSPTGLYSY